MNSHTQYHNSCSYLFFPFVLYRFSDKEEMVAGSNPKDPNDVPPNGVLGDNGKSAAVTAALLLDSDGDGIVDAIEKEDGTDRFNPDSDGDGASDADEKMAGTDPLEPKDTPVFEDAIDSVVKAGKDIGETSDADPNEMVPSQTPGAANDSVEDNSDADSTESLGNDSPGDEDTNGKIGEKSGGIDANLVDQESSGADDGKEGVGEPTESGAEPNSSSTTTDKGVYVGSHEDWDNDGAPDLTEDAALTDKYDINSTPQKGDSGT